MSNFKLETYVDTFRLGALMSKSKLETYVDTFSQGALMSKAKLETYVDKIEHGGINVDTAAPGRAREGDRIGKVRLG